MKWYNVGTNRILIHTHNHMYIYTIIHTYNHTYIQSYIHTIYSIEEIHGKTRIIIQAVSRRLFERAKNISQCTTAIHTQEWLHHRKTHRLPQHKHYITQMHDTSTAQNERSLSLQQRNLNV